MVKNYQISFGKSHFLRNELIQILFSIYDYQDNGQTFNTVEEFLQMLDQDFYTATRISLRKYLVEKGFNKRFIDEITQMSTLYTYSQPVDTIHAFPGRY